MHFNNGLKPLSRHIGEIDATPLGDEPRKKSTAGVQGGRIFQPNSVLALSTEILGIIIRFFKWDNVEMRHLSLTCRRLKLIVDSHPERMIRKAIFFIGTSPLNYCLQGPHPRLIQDANSLLSSVQVMKEDLYTPSMGTRFVNIESLFIFLQIHFPPPLIPLIASFVKYGNLVKKSSEGLPLDYLTCPNGSCKTAVLKSKDNIPVETYLNFYDKWLAKLPLELREAYQWNRSQIFEFKTLMRKPFWIQEDINSLDWSFIFKYVRCNPTYVVSTIIEDETDDQEIEVFHEWLDSVYQLHFHTPLSDECLLTLLICTRGFDLQTEVFDKLMANKAGDPKFMKLAVRCNPHLFEKCAPILKQDRSFVLALVAKRGDFPCDQPIDFDQVFPPLRDDKEIFLASLANRSSASGIFQKIGKNLRKELQTNKELLLQFLKHSGYFEFPSSFSVSPELADDEEFIGEAIKYNPYILKCASTRIKENKKILLKYLRQFKSFEFPSSFSLSPALAHDEEFIREAIKYSRNIFSFACATIKGNFAICLLYIQYQVETFKLFSLIPTSHYDAAIPFYIEKTGDLFPFKDDKLSQGLTLKAVEKNYKAYLYVHESWLSDESFISQLAQCNPLIILNYNDPIIKPLHQSVLEKLLQERDLFLKALQKQPGDRKTQRFVLFKLPIPDHFKSDREIALAATKKNPLEAHFIDPAFFEQEDFLRDLFDQQDNQSKGAAQGPRIQLLQPQAR